MLTVLQNRIIIYLVTVVFLMVKSDYLFVNILKIVVLGLLVVYYYFVVYSKEREDKYRVNHYEIPDFLFLVYSVSQIYKLIVLIVN